MSNKQRVKEVQDKIDNFVYRGIHDKKKLEQLKQDLAEAKENRLSFSLNEISYLFLEIFFLGVLVLIEYGVYTWKN